MQGPQDSTHSRTLLDMPSGCKLRVDELTGSLSDRSRLYSLGILPGTELEVCRSAGGTGNVCVRVRHCSLVLGESMAAGIHCCLSGDEGYEGACKRSHGCRPHRRSGHIHHCHHHNRRT